MNNYYAPRSYHNPLPKTGYHDTPSYKLVNRGWTENPRFLILQSSLATLMHLRSEEENEMKIETYTHSIELIKREISGLTTRQS